MREERELGSIGDPRETAAEAGLVYVSDEMPGIRRRKSGKGFSYRRDGGGLLRDRVDLARIRSLAVPPAWTDVSPLSPAAIFRPRDAMPEAASNTAITRPSARSGKAENMNI